MKLYTIQMAKHALATKMGFELTDITIKSNLHRQFTPTWSILQAWKGSQQTPEDWQEYVTGYKQRMNHSVKFYPEVWKALCEKEVVVLSCFCPCTTDDPLESYCHRFLLVGYLETFCKFNNIEFGYMGEIR